MKRIADIASLTAILFCAGALFWLFSPPVTADRHGFAVGATHTVHFGAPSEDVADTEVNDQLRDWVLYAVLEASGLDSDALRKTLYDVPAVRAGFNLPVAAFEFGETRYRVIGSKGTVVALLPRGRGDRQDQLAQIADAAFTTVGTRPRAVQVYEYSLDPAELTGTVTRLPDIPGDRLFTQEYQFTEKAIHSVEDLERFLAAADDVSSIQVKDGVLHLSGRRTGLRTGRMRTEDVAALWQSEKALEDDKRKIEEFDSRWQNENYLESVAEEEYKKQLAAIPAGDSIDSIGTPDKRDSVFDFGGLNSDTTTDSATNLHRFDSTSELGRKYPELSRTYPGLGATLGNRATGGAAARAELERRFKDREYLKALLQKKHDAEATELRRNLSSKGSEGIPQGSGFSLDPSFDYAKLEQVFDELQGFLRLDPTVNLADIGEHIRNKQEGPFLDALYKAQSSGNLLGQLGVQLAQSRLQRAKFQHARYDGRLAGTEDGMVLFYTDLLAKLWALDYFERAPEEQVRGFVPLLKISVSPIYEQESIELSGTRLWFGPRDSGFSKLKDGLAFSRIATRVYAASSNTLQPGKEAEANAASARFLGWWNDHYAQVADYEPQYKRLNEIMKWSAILGWLPSNGGLDQMSYLSSVTVKRDNWFPDWAQQNADLRFRDWKGESSCADVGHRKQKVDFYPKGYLGVETESMPILYSCEQRVDEERVYTISGGVSLGSRAEIENRAGLAESVEAAARRANLEPIQAAGNEAAAFRTTDKIEIRFPLFGKDESAVAEVKAIGKLRGDDVEMKGAPLRIGFRENADGLTVTVSEDGRPMSEVEIRHRPSGDIDIFERQRLQETARSIGRTIGRASGDEQSAIAAVGQRPEVRKAFESGDAIYVETRDTPGTWIRYRPEGKASVNIGDSVDMRMGFAGKQGSSRWNVTYVDVATANREIAAGGRYLVAEDVAGERQGVAFSVTGRGPPPPPGKKIITDFGDQPPSKRDVIAAAGGGGGRGRGGAGNPSGDGGSGGGPGGDSEASFGPDAVAFKAVHDPDHLLAWIEAKRSLQLKRADELVAQGKFEEAARELDDLVSIMPNDPDVLMRRAIAKAGSSAKDRAAAAAALKLDEKRMPEFAERLDAAALHFTDRQAEDAEAMLKGVAAKSKGRNARFYIDRDNVVRVEVALLDARRGTVAAASTDDLRYTFATVDTGASGSAAGTIPPPSKPLEIHDDVIAHFAPDRIYDQTSGHRYERVNSRPVRAANGGGPPRPPTYFRALWNTSSDCDSLRKEERARRPECRDTVVVDGGQTTTRAAL